MLKTFLPFLAAVVLGVGAFLIASSSMNKPAPTEEPPANPSASPHQLKSLVVYHADWCGPCRMLEQTLADPSVKAALEREGIWVQNLNVDRTRKGLWDFPGGGIPAYALVHGATVVRTGRGYLPPAEFKRWLEGK
jgi:thiol-disulfide isomerase/thioredoxin